MQAKSKTVKSWFIPGLRSKYMTIELLTYAFEYKF